MLLAEVEERTGSVLDPPTDDSIAVIEAFWSRMQVELLDTLSLEDVARVGNAIFEYIEVFHNRRRRPSSLGMRTPIE